MTQNHKNRWSITKIWPWGFYKVCPPPPPYPIGKVQEDFSPIFYNGKWGKWRAHLTLWPNFCHEPSIFMILSHISSIESFSMKNVFSKWASNYAGSLEPMPRDWARLCLKVKLPLPHQPPHLSISMPSLSPPSTSSLQSAAYQLLLLLKRTLVCQSEWG